MSSDDLEAIERAALEENRRAKARAIEARELAEKKKQAVEEKPEFAIELPPLPDTKDIKELALAVEDKVFETYYTLMMDSNTPAATRKACADALADRAKGKAEQAISQKVEVETSIDVSVEEVARLMLFAQRDAIEKGIDIIDVEPEDLTEIEDMSE